MIELICENKKTEERFNLTYNPYLKISNVEGLGIPSSETVTTTSPYIAGGRYQRSNVQERQIIISFYVVGNVNSLKLELFKVFKSGQEGTLYINGDYRSGKIDYVFEEMQINMFSFPVTMQLILKSPYPYFEGLDDIVQEIRNIVSAFVFPFSIPEEGIPFGEYSDVEDYTSFTNNGDIETGIEIQFVALGTVVNPSVYNVVTQEAIGANITLTAGETLVINTHVSQKSIKLRSGDPTRRENQINNIMDGSTWLQLASGENTFGYDADEGKSLCLVRFIYSNEYEEII